MCYVVNWFVVYFRPQCSIQSYWSWDLFRWIISTVLGQATSVARSQRYRHLFVSLNRAPKSREESRERIEILKSWRVLLPLTFFQTILGSTTLHFFIRNSGPKYWARLQVNNKLSKPRKMFSGCYFLIERGVNFLNMVILGKNIYKTAMKRFPSPQQWHWVLLGEVEESMST